MRLFKDKVTEKLWIEMAKNGGLIDFDGCFYDGDISKLIEVDTDPNKKDFRLQYTVEKKFDITVEQNWRLKDILFVPVEGNDVAFRVEHISKDRVYFVAVDAVGESTIFNMNEYLDNYLSKMPKMLRDIMCEMEHIVDDVTVCKSKLTLLSGKNASVNKKHDYSGTDDIEFDGLKTEAERCKNFKGETNCYWLDTPLEHPPYVDRSIKFLAIHNSGATGYYDEAGVELAVVPCFSVARNLNNN